MAGVLKKRSTASASSLLLFPADDSYRGRLRAALSSQVSECLSSIVILLNVVVMIAETDGTANCVTEGISTDICEERWRSVANLTFLCIYSIESILRLIGFGRGFFKHAWNNLDLFIVATGWFDMVFTYMSTTETLPVPNTSILRIFRIARLARILRMLSIFPELFLLVRGFIAALMSMFWGFIMIVVLIMVFSIITVEVVHPLNVALTHEDAYCEDAFGSVWNCFILFLQTLVAGDSWGMCAIPVIQRHPYVSLIFMAGLIIVQLGATNLILAVIVDRANRAHELDVEHQLLKKLEEQSKASHKLRECFQEIDIDKSGTISVRELQEGYDNNPVLQQQLRCVDIAREDLTDLFNFLQGSDEADEVAYDALVDTLIAASLGDLRKQLMMLRLQSSEMCRALARTHEKVGSATDKIHSIHSLVGEPSGEVNATTRATGIEIAAKKPPEKPCVDVAGPVHNSIDGDSNCNSETPSLVTRLPPMPPMQTAPDMALLHRNLRDKLDQLEQDVLQTIGSWASCVKNPKKDHEQETAVERSPVWQGKKDTGSQLALAATSLTPGDVKLAAAVSDSQDRAKLQSEAPGSLEDDSRLPTVAMSGSPQTNDVAPRERNNVCL